LPLENGLRCPELRQKSRPSPTVFTSGIPQWPSRDPIGEEGGINLYSFIENDPVEASDLLGLLKTGIKGNEPGLDPLDKGELPRIEKCTIYIFVLHLHDVIGGSVVEEIFNNLKTADRINELDSKSKNPCSRISFLSCFPQTALTYVLAYLRADKIDSLSALVMGLPLPNISLKNNMNPDKEGNNAKMLLQLSRAKAQAVARTQLCNCSCDCKEVTIRVQLYGGHWLTAEKRQVLPEAAEFLQNFYGGGSRWNPLFKDIIVPCDKNTSNK
jgi:hypothetical protein